MKPTDRNYQNLFRGIVSQLQAMPDLRVESIRAVRRDVSQQVADWPSPMVMMLARRLLGQSGFEFRLVAYELVAYHPEALRDLRARELERLGRNLDSWGAVDMFGCYLAGPVWREHQVSDGLIAKWAGSTDRWWRRAALVSTVPLNNKARGGRGDAERTLSICRLLVDDRDDMVVKAMSWALRALAVRNPQAVQQFLAEHRDRLAARVVREVRNKLSTGLKNPRRK
jgi:3-methyladenine DNA glycosylase AlkD